MGKRLVTAALAPFASVRQKVLLTDDDPGQRAFYESLGFAETHDFDDGSLARLRPVRLTCRHRSQEHDGAPSVG